MGNGYDNSGGEIILKVHSQILDTPEHKGIITLDRDHLQWQLLNSTTDNMPALVKLLIKLRSSAGNVVHEMTPKNGALLAQAIIDEYNGMEIGITSVNSDQGFLLQKLVAPTQKYEYKQQGKVDEGMLRKIFNSNPDGSNQ